MSPRPTTAERLTYLMTRELSLSGQLAEVRVAIGEEIRRRREAHDPPLSVEALAEEAGVSMSVVSLLERGQKPRFQRETVERVVDAVERLTSPPGPGGGKRAA